MMFKSSELFDEIAKILAKPLKETELFPALQQICVRVVGAQMDKGFIPQAFC